MCARAFAVLASCWLAGVGCAVPGSAGAAWTTGRCGSAPSVAAVSRGLSGVGFAFSARAIGGAGGSALVDGVSAVPGSRQAWALGGRFIDRTFDSVSYLLRFSGLGWTVAATFGPLVQLYGVSAVSGSAAWVWGQMLPKSYAPLNIRPFLALVSGGVVHPVRVPSRWRSVFPAAMASHGTADTWFSGMARDGKGRFQGAAVAWWDGVSWRAVPGPAGPRNAPGVLSTSGPSDTWAAAGGWVWHWNGTAWSRSYRPPVTVSRPDTQLVLGPIAASGGRAWFVFDTVSNTDPEGGPGPGTWPYSAYFDGSTWVPVPVPRSLAALADVTASGTQAWALQDPGGGVPRIAHVVAGSTGWCAQPPLPIPARPGCSGGVTSISAASPAYVVAIGGAGRPGCAFAYIYDGRTWRPASPRPAAIYSAGAS